MAKSTDATDDNLYDGLYGDDFEEDFTLPDEGQSAEPTADKATAEPEEPQVAASAAEPESQAPAENQNPSQSTAAPAPTKPIETTTLPPKPSTSGEGPNMSYSAQVAQQFSAYRQTPSQERQQRLDARMSQTLPSDRTSQIPSNADRPIRPSEMKDEG
ncbi:hypothetical protein DENSPDRAFT_311368 [Dentipellis sp. KUC8613]|nr:hypothetical protein DENSPDRAFT_311368 [Dentipellis sp. KUC8613]